MLPHYATKGSAGLDLRACIDNKIIIIDSYFYSQVILKKLPINNFIIFFIILLKNDLFIYINSIYLYID